MLIQGRNATVLVVEDEVLVRWYAADILEDAGHRAITADCADEALMMLEAHPEIDAVFADVALPGAVDGIALARLIRHRRPHVGLILTSAWGDIDVGALPLGTVFLSKPYAPRALTHALEPLLH
jgi:DNA-binding NtrC family response regulator